jgi:prevent-host-death family protein
MTEVTSKEAKERFGVVIDAARREPVTVTRHKRKWVVIMSAERYEELEALEDAYWVARAEAGEKSGYLSVEESEAFLQEMLNAEG